MTFARWAGAVVCAAALYAAAFPPLGAWPLALVALAPFAASLHGAGAWQAAGRAWALGVLANALGCCWVASVHPAALVLLPPVAALYWLPVGPLVVWGRRLGWPAAAALPVAWVVAEWIRLALPVGFPYLLLGLPLADAPVLAQGAALGGVALLSGLCAASGGWLGDAVAHGRGWSGAATAGQVRWGGVAVAAAWLAVASWGVATWRTEFAPGPVVAAVQANVPQSVKHSRPTTDQHEALSRAAVRAAGAPPALLCWPETMAEPLSYDGAALTRVQALARELRCPLLVGTVGAGMEAGVADAGRWNSAVLLDTVGRLRARYDKHRLVVPTEWLPTRGLLPATEQAMLLFVGGVPDFASGVRSGALPVPGDSALTAGALVCYEIAYAGLARAWVRDGATVLVNLTNEGWFPGSSEFAQLWQHARLRAIETRTPVVRAANTGWSGCIAPNGVPVRLETAHGPAEWLGENAGGEAGTWFRVAVPLDDRGTPFRTLGDWVSWLALALAVGAVAAAWRPVTSESRRPLPPA